MSYHGWLRARKRTATYCDTETCRSFWEGKRTKQIPLHHVCSQWHSQAVLLGSQLRLPFAYLNLSAMRGCRLQHMHCTKSSGTTTLPFFFFSFSYFLGQVEKFFSWYLLIHSVGRCGTLSPPPLRAPKPKFPPHWRECNLGALISSGEDGAIPALLHKQCF